MNSVRIGCEESRANVNYFLKELSSTATVLDAQLNEATIIATTATYIHTYMDTENHG
jgi:hypothetical protein